MVRVSSAEFSKDAGRFQDMALNQPVIVTSDGRDRTVMISAEEYDRLKRRDRQVFATADLPNEIIEAVRQSEMDPKHAHLDRPHHRLETVTLPGPEAGLVVRYSYSLATRALGWPGRGRQRQTLRDRSGDAR